MPRSTREIRRRINTVRSTQQITRAMEMVSVAKLRRTQTQLEAARHYTGQLEEMMGRLLADPGVLAGGGFDPVILKGRSVVRQVVYVVIAADRGLCGGLNVNLLRYAARVLAEEQRPYQVFCLGRKSRDFFASRRYPLAGEIAFLGDSIDFALARKLSRQLVDLLRRGDTDEVYVVYNQFLGPGREKPAVRKLLPLSELLRLPVAPNESETGRETLLVPSRAAVLEMLLPRVIDAEFYLLLLEAKASEHGARMTAMHNATKNAEELIESLQLSYNKARQAAITKELAEIVAGAEALTQGGSL
ncbi:MAG: ATP synthase F1 subunit gamma [Limnochordales bacterium]|nr:ATP synthase F1 subunit gamma [Limnochordales bacterium]